MPVSNAVINISNLRLRTYIGFNPEEQEKLQDVVINVEVHYPTNKLCLEDSVENALNYKTIAKKIIAYVEGGQFLLLERLVSDVLEIASEHDWVEYAKVRIDKPHALRFADSVSLTLEYHKSKND